MKPPLSQPGAEEPSVKAQAARKDGGPYLSLSGYPWQEWLVTMTDGTVRRTGVHASGTGSGPRAARQNAEEGPCRDLSQPTFKESTAQAVREGRRLLPAHVVAEYCGEGPGAPPRREAGASSPALHAGPDFPDAPMASPGAGNAQPATARTATTAATRSGRQVPGPGRRR